MNLIRHPLAPIAGFVAALISALVALIIDRRPRPFAALITGLGVTVSVAAIETWETARPNRLWHGYVGGARTRIAPPVAPRERPPQHRDLVAVVAVGQVQARPGATVMLLALEIYTDGLLAHSRILLDTERIPSPIGERGHPPRMAHLRPTLDLRDDRGTPYHLRPASGGGGGSEYRFAHHASPAPPPEARALTITLPALRWEEFGPQSTFEVGDTIAGPWTFAVMLPNARPDEASSGVADDDPPK